MGFEADIFCEQLLVKFCSTICGEMVGQTECPSVQLNNEHLWPHLSGSHLESANFRVTIIY